jgi:hypothetical protein
MPKNFYALNLFLERIDLNKDYVLKIFSHKKIQFHISHVDFTTVFNHLQCLSLK